MSLPAVVVVGVAVRSVDLDQALDERFEITDPEARQTLHVNLGQPAGGDQAFNRPHRHAEPFGCFSLRDQESIWHVGILTAGAAACRNWRVVADPGEAHQEVRHLLDLAWGGQSLLMEPTHMSVERKSQMPDNFWYRMGFAGSILRGAWL